MKHNFKTTGIVIRKVDFNEADRIVTVLTDDMGKIDCIAKGARRFKSKFCGRLEVFNDIRITCYQGKDLAIIKEVETVSGISDNKNIDMHKTLFYIAELTNRLIQSSQQIDEVYPLLQQTLSCLEQSEKYEVLLHGYLIKILTMTGFLPSWNKCATCNEALDLEKPIFLSTIDAHTICDCCRGSSDRILSISFVKWVNFMQKYPLTEILKVRIDENDHQSVWQWLNGILNDLLNSPIKSEEFMKV